MAEKEEKVAMAAVEMARAKTEARKEEGTEEGDSEVEMAAEAKEVGKVVEQVEATAEERVEAKGGVEEREAVDLEEATVEVAKEEEDWEREGDAERTNSFWRTQNLYSWLPTGCSIHRMLGQRWDVKFYNCLCTCPFPYKPQMPYQVWDRVGLRAEVMEEEMREEGKEETEEEKEVEMEGEEMEEDDSTALLEMSLPHHTV